MSTNATETLESLDASAWHRIAAETTARLDTNHFINGTYTKAIDGGVFEAINPATGDVVTEVAAGTVKDVDAAVAAAQKSFKAGVW